MTLKSRIRQLERCAGIGARPRLTVEFFDSLLNGTLSHEEFERHAPLLRELVPAIFAIPEHGENTEAEIASDITK
jgi:hypothetical protein